MYKYLALSLLFVVPTIVFSQNYSLSKAEKKSVQMAKKWINNNTNIIKQRDGSLGFYYGDNMPTLICKPLNATIVKLERGEEFKDLRTGDAKRWKFDIVENATDGRTFILVKPTKSNIMTNLIIFTNKRIYNIKLIASNSDWTPSISFIYEKKETYGSKKEPFVKKIQSKASNQTHKPTKKIKKSKYIISSNGIWKPNKIFTKKGKTYIEVGKENINNTRLFIMNNKTSSTIKYTHKDKYLVVNIIIQKAILIKDSFSKTTIKIRRRK